MVRKISLDEVARAISGKLAGRAGATAISSVGTDTRDMGCADLFFALEGPRFDGHDFLTDAARSGARAAVVRSTSEPARRFAEGHPDFPLVRVKDTLKALGDLAAHVRSQMDVTAVGITGTTGKTCTKDFLVSILDLEGSVAASEGSFNNEIGLPLTILGARPSDSWLVVEMGARKAGDIRRLAQIARPSAGIITNVGPGHLELFKTMDAVAKTKGELARALPEGGILVLNADDPATRKMARETRARAITFGRGKKADYRATSVRLDEGALPSFDLAGPDIDGHVDLPAVGRHQVENALAAAACAHALGIASENIAKGLERAGLSRWRTECVRCGCGYLLINDAYNANPVSMEAALRTLAETGASRRKVAVLGGMAELGSRSEDYHHEAGHRAARLGADIVLTVGRRGRWIAAGAVAEGLPRGSVFRCEDAASALEVLSCFVEPDDVILVKASRVEGLERICDGLASPDFLEGKLVANV